MESRTLYAMFAAGALLMTGVASAEGNATASKTYPKPSEAGHPTWKLQILPGEAWVPAGTPASFSIVLGSRVDTTVKLSIVKATEGATATLSTETIDVLKGGSSSVRLIVTAPENATRSPYVVVVQGMSESGETHDARAAVYLKERPAAKDPRPEAKPLPKPADEAKPKPIANEDAGMKRLAERIERLEQQLSRLERILCALAGDRAPAELCPRAEAATRTS